VLGGVHDPRKESNGSLLPINKLVNTEPYATFEQLVSRIQGRSGQGNAKVGTCSNAAFNA